MKTWIGLAIAFVAVGVSLDIFLTGEPNLPTTSADGIYSNICCGSLTLHNGKLVTNTHQTTSYVIAKDKVGAFVLPAALVSVLDGQTLSVEGSKYPLKLRLDREQNPSSMTVIGAGSTYIFKRQ